MNGSLLYLDTTALLRRYVAAPDRGLVIDAMETAGSWAASTLSRTEIMLAFHDLAASPDRLSEMWTLVRGEWDAVWEISVDQRCLSTAVDIGSRFGLGTIDAVQLACASRLPRPAAFCTFERQQIPAAVELGFEVISPFA